jgi:hypothetical protein
MHNIQSHSLCGRRPITPSKMFDRPHLTPGSAMLSVAALARMPRRSACENRNSSDISTVFAGVDEYQHAGYQLGITAQFVLVCRALLPAARPRRH